MLSLSVTDLLQMITHPNCDHRLVEICLKALRYIYQHPFAPSSQLHRNSVLIHLLGLAGSDSCECQASVANILQGNCQTYNEQIPLFRAGAVPLLSRLITSPYLSVKRPALKSLAGLCFTNRQVSDSVCSTLYNDQSVPDILTSLTSRARPVEIQLSAARCLTYLHRSGSLEATDPRIEYKALPCLVRLSKPEFDEEIRATAAETLAYLAEVSNMAFSLSLWPLIIPMSFQIDSYLQRLAAISNDLVKSLSSLLDCKSTAAKQGAFRCFASLAANDEDIRKRIIDTSGLMDCVLAGLKDDSPDVRLASVRCLHSLSRSVQQLRTTFQDHSVWRPLMALLTYEPSNELLTVVTSTICNLLLEFSPAKEPLLESGAVKILCELTQNPDAALRLNGCWALMNMTFQAGSNVKTNIINTLGTERLLQLLTDSDTRVIMKTLGLLRNLLSSPQDIDNIMTEHSSKVMSALNLVLDSSYSSEVKEQALCIVGNIGAEAQSDYVLDDENTLRKLGDLLVNKNEKLHAAAFFAIVQLVHTNDTKAHHRKQRLREAGILLRLEESLQTCKTRLYME